MVKSKKNKNTEAAVGTQASTETSVANSALISSDLAPSKKIKKGLKKGEGASDVLTNPTTSANPNSSGEVNDKDAGFIFMCNSKTKPECYKHGVFGMPKGRVGLVESIKPGTRLFLYDFDSRLMYGVYTATSKGGMNLAPMAFGGAFPAQVKFKIDKDCLPLPESNFREAIMESYDYTNKFQPVLNSKQVNKLVALFQPVTAMPRPAPTQIVDDRHASPTYLPPPSDPYRSTHLSSAHLPPPQDPYRSKMHLAPAHLLSSIDTYPARAPVHESRYLPSHVPSQAVNDTYNPAHFLHAPISLFQPSGPPHAPPLSYLYHQAEAGRAYQSENPIPSDRHGYRMPSDMPPVDPNVTAAHRAREYYLSLVRTEGGAIGPRAVVDDPYRPHLLTADSSVTNLNPQPQLSSSYIQGQRQPSGASANVPVSSLYSFAGGSALSYR